MAINSRKSFEYLRDIDDVYSTGQFLELISNFYILLIQFSTRYEIHLQIKIKIHNIEWYFYEATILQTE